MMKLTDKEKVIILSLYPEYDSITEYDLSSDGRYRVRLAKKGTSTQVIRQRAAVILESMLNRRLLPHETVDHIDENPLNDDRSNLQLLTRSENSAKSLKHNPRSLGYKQPEHHKRSGSKNGMAKFTDEQVINYRNLFENKLISKKQISEETGISIRVVANMLNRVTYLIN